MQDHSHSLLQQHSKMKKNIIKYLLPVLLAATTVSCNEWLNVTSSSELQADKLFETRAGFHEALTGVYMSMGGSTTYGGSYMWSVNNYAAYPYITNIQLAVSEVQKHKYTLEKIKFVFDGMWFSGYNVIANINIILRELDARRNVIESDIEYKLNHVCNVRDAVSFSYHIGCTRRRTK